MNILVVDDEKKITDVLTERLRLRGFHSMPAYDAASALSIMEEQAFDGVILDLRLPDVDGIEVLRRARKRFPALKVVVLSGHGNEQDFKTCLELGAVACFHKPAKIRELIEAFAGACDETASGN